MSDSVSDDPSEFPPPSPLPAKFIADTWNGIIPEIRKVGE